MGGEGAEMEGGGSMGEGGGTQMEVEAFRRLYPHQFLERYLVEGTRPDGRPLGRSRPASLALNALSTADGSAMVKLGNTTMLAAIKLEVMTPQPNAADQGCIVVDFQMPPICSPLVRPGRPAEAASVISEQLSSAIASSRMVDPRDLCIAQGKATWMVYLDVYCLDADGSLLDAALFASVAALSNLQIPAVSLTDEGRVVPTNSSSDTQALSNNPAKSSPASPKRRLKLGDMPVALTCSLHSKYMLADPTAEEESILPTSVTIILDSSGRLISFYKPGGEILAMTTTVLECIALTKYRVKELQTILDNALAEAEG